MAVRRTASLRSPTCRQPRVFCWSWKQDVDGRNKSGHDVLETRDLIAETSTVAHALSTKLSTTRFSPALSNWIVSLLPSIAVTLPLPNFWWKTRSPSVKSETVPVDFATRSPSMVSGRRREPPDSLRARQGDGDEVSSKPSCKPPWLSSA